MPRNAVGALGERRGRACSETWDRNVGFAAGKAQIWLCSAPANCSSPLTSQSLGKTSPFLLGFWNFHFSKQLLIADALCRSRGFLQGWNCPGIFYGDEIAQEFSMGMEFPKNFLQGWNCPGMKFWSVMRSRARCLQAGCPLWIRGHWCPQEFWWQSISLCSSQDVSPSLQGHHGAGAVSATVTCLWARGDRAAGSSFGTVQRSQGRPGRGDVALGPLWGEHIFWEVPLG